MKLPFFITDWGLFLGRRPDGRFRFGVWPGGVTLIMDRGVYCFRPPWSEPMFSERYGLGVKHIFKVGGWRLFVRGAAE